MGDNPAAHFYLCISLDCFLGYRIVLGQNNFALSVILLYAGLGYTIRTELSNTCFLGPDLLLVGSFTI